MKTKFSSRMIMLLFGVLAVAAVIIGCAANQSTEAAAIGSCPLCGEGACSDPVLINLATGERGEITTNRPGEEITEEYFRFLSVAGLQGYHNGNSSCHVVLLPQERAKLSGMFCKSCRDKLEAFASSGYVLADLRDTSDAKIYTPSVGADYMICGHRVTVTSDEEGHLTVNVFATAAK